MKRSSLLHQPAVYRAVGVREPRSDVFDPPARGLPRRTSSAARGTQPSWLFVAAHGGSGATLLSKLSWLPCAHAIKQAEESGVWPDSWPAYGINAGVAWPDPTLEPTNQVVVVAKTTMHGLSWARDAAAQYLAGHTPPGTELLGLVTVADQPGRLPKPISAALGLLTGAYPRTWHVPYVPAYRLLTSTTDEQTPDPHPAIADVLDDIRASVTMKGHTP